MEFRVLGPLAVVRGGSALASGGSRQRVVLSMLLLATPQAVSVEAIIDAVWPDDPPATAREQVRICISQLRQRLDTRSGPAQISTRPPGYALELGEAAFDLVQFVDAVGAGRARAAEGSLEAAATALGEALRLWRGSVALEGVRSPPVRAAATRLEEQRLTVLEEHVDLLLRLGLHTEVVDLLGVEIDRHPLRERLRAQLMLALFRSGRKADALLEFRRVRQVTTDELGLEPGDELQRLEQAILRDEPGLAVPQSELGTAAAQVSPPPQLLPAPIADFTGRGMTLSAVTAAITSNSDARTRPAPVVVVSGPAGVGKTALAVYAANRLAAEHPDGQLFANMRGATQPARAATVLERFLRALGVPQSGIPDELDDRAELFRDRLASRRVLIVLDDVASLAQVQPLLPASNGSAIIITSRRRITALPGATLIGLSPFRPSNALALLRSVVGEQRTSAEPKAAAELVHLCGFLPLAVRIAGARLAARPDWSVAEMVDRIHEVGQLDELNHDGLAVRATLRLSYEALTPLARMLLRRLSLLAPTDFGAWVCSALLGVSPRAGQDVLGELVETHLVELHVASHPASTRYRLHDLVRLVARECADAEDEPIERAEAVRRFLGALLHLTDAAHRREYGGDYLTVRSDAARYVVDDRLVQRLMRVPLEWLAAERQALSAAVEQAAAMGEHRLSWSLALNAVTLFEAHAHFDDWRETHSVALAAARRADDRLGEAVMLYSTGSLHIFDQQFHRAGALLSGALDIFVELGHHQGIALVRRNQAFIDRVHGDHDRAQSRLTEALGTFRYSGDRIGEAHVLSALAQLDIDCKRIHEAQRRLEQAAAMCAGTGNGRVSAQVMHRLGDLHLAQGRLDEAQAAFAHVLAFADRSGDPIAQVFALTGIGTVESRRGAARAARRQLERAERLAEELGEQRMQLRALLVLGDLSLTEGLVDQARRETRAALSVSLRLGSPVAIAHAESQLGDVELAAGSPTQAREKWLAALDRLNGVSAAQTEELGLSIRQRLDSSDRIFDRSGHGV